MLNARTASMELACRILGIAADASRSDAFRAFGKLAKQHYPDLGGDPQEMCYANSAWTYYKAARHW
jgi:hypothetical protein